MFNFEGGCYAKVIRLRPETEPEIYAATRMFGTVLENVVLDPATRARRLRRRPHHREHPRLLSDPLHPQSSAQRRRRPSQEHRLPDRRRVRRDAPDRPAHAPSRRCTTSSRATPPRSPAPSAGVTEPSATFSACFGAPFLPLPSGGVRQDAGRADRAARSQGLAGEHRLDRRPVRHRLADEAGPHPRHGRARRWPARSTRRRSAPIRCSASRCPWRCPDVPAEVLDSAAAPGPIRPRTTPRPGSSRTMFRENFEQYRSQVPPQHRGGGRAPTA